MNEDELSDEEIKRAYMGTDYHPSFKLTMEIKHGIERVVAKVKQHYEQKLRIKNPFEKKLPVNSTAGEGAYLRGCYDGFERLRRELKK